MSCVFLNKNHKWAGFQQTQTIIKRKGWRGSHIRKLLYYKINSVTASLLCVIYTQSSIMDKVKDESPPVERRQISFLTEDGEKVEAAQREEESVGDLNTIDWDKNPPVAEIKVGSKYYKKERKVSERVQKCHQILSLVIVSAVIIFFWVAMLLPQLCFFGAGICSTSSPTSSGSTNVS